MKSVHNVIWSLAGLGTRTIIQVVYFVLLARVLGPQEYGAFASSLSIIYVFVPYATWGAGDILVKNVSRNKKMFSEYWGSALLSITIFGSIFFLVTLFLYYLLLAEQVSVWPVIWLGLSELFFLRIIDTSMQAYQAFERLSRTALIQSGFGLIRLLFTLFFVGFVHDHSVNIWSVLYLLSTIIAAVSCLILVRVELGKPRFILHVKNNLRDGFYFCLSPSSQSIYNDFDKSILPKYASLGVTGNYSAAYKIIDALFTPIKAMLQTFYARFFFKGASGLDASRKLALKLFPVFFFYSVCAAIGIVFFSRYIPILFGSSYDEAVKIIQILSPVIVFRAVHSLGADTLTGAGMQGKRSMAQLFVAVLNAALCLLLIPTYGWVGAAWSSLISDGVLAIFIWIIIFSSSPAIHPVQNRLDENEPAPVKPVLD